MPTWRLENLMKFEIDEVGTQSGGDVSADYRKLDLPDPEGERDDDTILVALARNTHLDSLIQALDTGGIKFGEGCPNSVALFNAFAVNATYTEEEVALLVNIGADNVDIAVQQGGELVFARNATPGGQAFTEAVKTAFNTTASKAEKMKRSKGDVTPKGEARYPDPTSEKVANAMIGVAGQLASMIQSTLMIAKAQTRMPELKVDRVLLSGGGASLKGIAKYLKQAMGVPVERFDPFVLCDTSGLTPEEQAMIESAPHEFTVAVGLAQAELSPATFRLSVMPAALKRVRDFLTKGIWAVGAAAVMLGVLVMMYSARDSASTETKKAAARLQSVARDADKQDRKLREELAAVEDLEVKHMLLAQRAAPGALLAEVVNLLRGILADNALQHVYLTEVALDVKNESFKYSLMVPKSKMASGYEAVQRTRRANPWREAEVRVKGQISGGSVAGALYQDFYQACRANKYGLEVEAPSGFRSGGATRDGSFELVFRAGAVLTLSEGPDGGGGGEVMVRDLSLDDFDEPQFFVGRYVDGTPLRIPVDTVERVGDVRTSSVIDDMKRNRPAGDTGGNGGEG